MPASAEIVCPRCGQPLPTERHGVRLTPLKARIFDAIKRAGPDGIDSDVLHWLIYGERDDAISRRTLKAHIWQINELFADEGLVIRGTRGTGRCFTLHYEREDAA